MYETIMELPLFKGIGEEQLSVMLEKTSLEFLKYEEGDLIAEAGKTVSCLDFLLSGRVRQTYKLENFNIEIDEIVGKGSVLGAVRLYGLETTYPADCRANGKVSLMRISKTDYMNILQSDSIYMLNFVNFLSAAAQKSSLMFQQIKSTGIARSLNILAFTFASGRAETVMVVGEDNELARYCGVEIADFEEWKTSELAHNRIIVNKRGIILKSPHLLR